MADPQQPQPAASQRAPTFSPLFIVMALAVLAVGVWLEYPAARAVFSQARIFFLGPDDYMRTYRAKQVAENQAARIRHMEMINAPRGARLHWTAPMDYLLAGAMVAFTPLVDHDDAAGYVAAWVPTCLGVLYVVCLMSFMRRGFGAGPAVLAGLLVVLSPAFHRVFGVGHPDHHCLLELMMLVGLAPWIPRGRVDGMPGRPTTTAAILSGVATGLAIWIAAQAVFFWLAMALGLTAACMFGPPASRRIYTERRLVWNCAAALVVLVGFVFENWPDLNEVTVDGISLVHLALMAIAFLMPTRLGVVRPPAAEAGEPTGSPVEETPSRLQAQTNRNIAMLAAVAAFVVWMGFDRGRAFEHVRQSAFHRWSEHIVELQPLYTSTLTDWSVRPMHDYLGFLPYAFPVLLLCFFLSKQVPRPVKGALGLLAPAILILTVRQMRWLDHFNLALTPVAVIGSWELARLVLGNAASRAQSARLAIAGVLLGLLIFPSARFIASLTPEGAVYANKYQGRTDFVAQKIIAHEDAHPSASPDRRAILCEDGEGPMLLYCTELPVVATPYHRALDGLLEAARFYAERDPQTARDQLDRLGVRYVVMPPRGNDQLMQFEKIAFGELRSFDPPTETINQVGRIMRKLNYRQELARTMAYRLVMDAGVEVIPGVKRIAEINEGARTPDGEPILTGLLYVVNELPPASRPAATPETGP